MRPESPRPLAKNWTDCYRRDSRIESPRPLDHPGSHGSLRSPIDSLRSSIEPSLAALARTPFEQSAASLRSAARSLRASLAHYRSLVPVLTAPGRDRADGPFQSAQTSEPHTSPANCGAHSLRSLCSSSLAQYVLAALRARSPARATWRSENQSGNGVCRPSRYRPWRTERAFTALCAVSSGSFASR